MKTLLRPSPLRRGARKRFPALPALLPVLALLAARPAAAVSTSECSTFADDLPRQLEAENSALATSGGCGTATATQVCEAQGRAGPCSTAIGCNSDRIVVTDECTSANELDSCCLLTYRNDCSSNVCTLQTTGVCLQRCDSSSLGLVALAPTTFMPSTPTTPTTSTPSTPTTPTTFTPSTPTTRSSDNSDDGSTGVAIGVSIGVVLAVAAAIGVTSYLCCCRKPPRPAAQPVKPGFGQGPLPAAAAPGPAVYSYTAPGHDPLQPSAQQHGTPQQQTAPAQYAHAPARQWQPSPYAPPPPPPPPGHAPPPGQPGHASYKSSNLTGTASYAGSQVPTVHAHSTASATESSVPHGTATGTAQTTTESQHAVNPYALVDTKSTTFGQTTFGQTTLAPRQPPAAGAEMEERKDFLHYQLDTLAGREVLGGLVLEQGMTNRMQGGQAIIQFAKDRRSGLFFALKFFLSNTAFADEVALYTDTSSPLGFFLPQLRNIAGAPGHGAPIADAHGQPLPPCIAMEKGESLDVWMKRNRDGMDMVTGLQVIQHVAERLADLHAAGYVHRDLKQSNVMWLPRENRWTLIDFGCAARIGETAPLSYSLRYAPPEVVRGVRAGHRTIVADTAMDAWTLGIVAVELFSNSATFAPFEGNEQVMAKIVGEQPLPWEEGAEGSAELLRRLGRFREGILGLLQRDPQQRLAISAFIGRCRSVLEQTVAA